MNTKLINEKMIVEGAGFNKSIYKIIQKNQKYRVNL